MPLSEAQILELAPDAAAAKSGKDLANAIAKWKNMGCDETAIWGQCQGSGKDAYLTQVDINNTAFKCSCPSRKFPCKHGIGLYLLYARQIALFSEREQPAWVQEWISKRIAKSEQIAPNNATISAEKAEKQAKDKEKRAAQRNEKVQNGINELNLLLKDLVRGGLLSFQSKAPSFWSEKAAHLVDAQASGIANLLHEFKQINYAAPNWQLLCMQQLSKLYLLANAYQNLDALPQALQHDIKNLIGWSAKKEEIMNHPNATTISDTWLVCGKQIEENTEQKISTQYIWLYGQQSQQYALLLDFATPFSPFSYFLVPNTAQEATLTFYPSAAPFRALLHDNAQTNPFAYPSHLYPNFETMGNAYAQRLSLQPFADKIPFWVKQINISKHQNYWYGYDQNGLYIPLHAQFEKIYTLLALSGGMPCDMCLIYYQQQIIPLGIWANEQYEVI